MELSGFKVQIVYINYSFIVQHQLIKQRMLLIKGSERSRQAQILNKQIERLQQSSLIRPLTPDFWFGYISSYCSQTCSQSKRPLTPAQWQQLFSRVQMAMEIAQTAIIQPTSLPELFVCALHAEIQEVNVWTFRGVDAGKLCRRIQNFVNQLASDPSYLRDFFLRVEEIQMASIKVESKVQPIEKVQQRKYEPITIQRVRRTSPIAKQTKVQMKQEPKFKISTIEKIPSYKPLINEIKTQKKQLNPQPSAPLIKKYPLLPSPLQMPSSPKSKYFKPSIKKQEEPQPESKKQGIELGISCQICLSPITLSTICPVSCGHNLHRDCLVEHFRSKVESKKFPICCPQEGCNEPLTIQDIQEYIPKVLLDKYYDFSLHQFVEKNQKNTSWCPTAGCPAVFEYDEELKQYRCPSCKHSFCLECKTESHKGITCRVNKTRMNLPEDERNFIKFAEGAKMKQCPNCKFWVQKSQGCDHMTCRCSYEFCFRCGAKYGGGDCECDKSPSFYGGGEEDEAENQLREMLMAVERVRRREPEQLGRRFRQEEEREQRDENSWLRQPRRFRSRSQHL